MAIKGGMSEEDAARLAAEIKDAFREMGEHALDPANVPRHPRGFQGRLEYVDTIPVIIARDPATGRLYTINPTELQPGKGETPAADVFAQDYSVVGTRRGTSIVDVILRAVPVVLGGGGAGGLIEAIFGGKR